MRNILITGGAGFIGANFVHYWHDKYPEDQLVVLDALTYAGNLASIDALIGNNCHLVHGSITDSEMVKRTLRQHTIDTVVHFAAESHVDRSISGPDVFIETNVVGTHNLLSACREYWLSGDGIPHRFHNVSTDEVFGMLGPDDPPFMETTRYAPSSPYSASKAAADHLALAYHHTYGLQVSISNCSNNYGPYHFPEKLIPLTIVNLLIGKQIPVYGSGMNIRDWLHVSDHCRAIDKVLSAGKPGEAYNVGANCEVKNIDVVKAICRAIDHEFEINSDLAARYSDAHIAQGRPSETSITSVADRPGHDFRYAIDAKKIKEELNFECESKFEDGLTATVRWFIENENWWRAVMDGSYREYIRQSYGTL